MLLHKPRTELILCGDTSVNFLIDSNYKTELSLLLQFYNMFNVTDFLTRINKRLGSAIDGIFIDGWRVNLSTVASISNGLSDHEAQYIVLEKLFPDQKVLPHYRTWSTKSLATLQDMVYKKSCHIIGHGLQKVLPHYRTWSTKKSCHIIGHGLQKVLPNYRTWSTNTSSLNYFLNTIKSKTWEKNVRCGPHNVIFNLFLHVF